MKRLLLIALSMLCLPCTVLADWDAPKWVQLPDVTTNGLDVQATSPGILADDFLCTEPSLITDIHIWGSWLNDYLPVDGSADAGNVTFTLSIHADIPESPTGGGYSMPGDILWEKTFNPGEFAVRPYLTGIQEGWYDPGTGEYIPSLPNPADTICWQYNFLIDYQEAWRQQGTPANPVIYWLNVQAFPSDQDVSFGWKSSLWHWNDDAVWWDGRLNSGLGGWAELIYPDGHEYAGDSIDMAFVITPEPATIALLGIGWAVVLTRKRQAV